MQARTISDLGVFLIDVHSTVFGRQLHSRTFQIGRLKKASACVRPIQWRRRSG